MVLQRLLQKDLFGVVGVLKEKLPKDQGRGLEMASGSGMCINFFAPHFDHLHFHPTDKDQEVFYNIKQLTADHGNDNIADSVHLDLTDPDTWFNPGDKGSFDAIFCINIFQVAPISIADGMMECAWHLLNDDGILLIYGLFKVEGSFTSDSNKEFHETLASHQVPEWGLKNVADLKKSRRQPRHGAERNHRHVGLSEGDAHVIRNAGGRASDDAIRSLVISYKLLGTRE